jgi:hypothetical protein
VRHVIDAGLRQVAARAAWTAVLLLVLSKPFAGQTGTGRLGVEFVDGPASRTMDAGGRHRVRMTLRNTGNVVWTTDVFHLSYHWADGKGVIVVADGERTSLPHPVPPGTTIDVCAVVVAPAVEGSYALQWDMVQESVAWFSDVDRGNLRPEPVSVVREEGAASTRNAMIRMLSFLLLTIGHAAVVAAALSFLGWQTLRNIDEHLFYSTVMAVGTLQAILHALASTIGISFAGGLFALLAFDVALMSYARRQGMRVPPSDPEGRTRPAIPWLAVPGLAVVLSLLLQWFAASSASLRVTGADAAHYHVPHAINFAHGANLFGFVATPHLYPMGTSIWAAWLLQPLQDALLLDLMTVPAFLLLIASIAWLCRAATGDSGLVWAPWLTLFMLTAPLVRVSLLPSADFMYAAAFVAFFTQCFLAWRARAVRSIDMLGGAFSAGILVSSKATGVVSMLLIVAVFAAWIGIERLQKSGRRMAWSASGLAVALSMSSFFLAGGIWLVRNWVIFDSPLAPSGLSVGGLTIFPGDAYLEGGYYYSVLKDLGDSGYDLAGRSATYARRLIGRWFLPLSLSLLILAADAVLEWRQSRRLSAVTSTRLWLLATTSALALMHAGLLIPAPWTSLEWTRGLSLRYVLPFILLYIAQMGFCLFSPTLLPWQANPAARHLVAIAAMALATLYYRGHSATPDLPALESFPVLNWPLLAFATAIVVSWVIGERAGRFWKYGSAGLLVLVLARLASQIVADDERLIAEARRSAKPASECGGGTPEGDDYRCVYSQVLAFERREGIRGGQRRLFVVSRFDAPLELQGPGLENLVFDVRGRTERASILQSRGPGTGPRDYVVIDVRENEEGNSRRLAYRRGLEAGMEMIGACGRYQVYRVKSGRPN